MSKKKPQLKLNYLIIPIVTISVAIIGSAFTTMGMNWYDTQLIQPELTPPKWLFPVAWNTIFVLTTISALLLWNKLPHQASTLKKLYNCLFKKIDKEALFFRIIFWLFALNAILNVGWSFLFFANRLILPAFIEMLFLEATLIALIILTWSKSRAASIMLWPYAAWVGFATFLTFRIFQLNS